MGVVLLLYCSSPGAQCSKGSLQAFKQYVLSSLNLSESNPLLRGGLSLLYFKVGPRIYIFLSWCLGPPGGLSSSSVGGPGPVGWQWRGLCQVGFLGRRVVNLLSRVWSVRVALPLGRAVGGHLLSVRPYCCHSSFPVWLLTEGWHAH
jgi:hypothetical protein